jgi:hypothetical protein
LWGESSVCLGWASYLCLYEGNDGGADGIITENNNKNKNKRGVYGFAFSCLGRFESRKDSGSIKKKKKKKK